MPEPVIHFKDMDASPALEEDIRRRFDQLLRRFSAITSCRVTIEGKHAPHMGNHHGIPYRVCVDVQLPGAELVVGRSPAARAQNVDVNVAVRDAFRTARREVLELKRRMRGEVKTHAAAV
jgi:ribosome-associated translation inhibitor RaiA